MDSPSNIYNQLEQNDMLNQYYSNEFNIQNGFQQEQNSQEICGAPIYNDGLDTSYQSFDQQYRQLNNNTFQSQHNFDISMIQVSSQNDNDNNNNINNHNIMNSQNEVQQNCFDQLDVSYFLCQQNSSGIQQEENLNDYPSQQISQQQNNYQQITSESCQISNDNNIGQPNSFYLEEHLNTSQQDDLNEYNKSENQQNNNEELQIQNQQNSLHYLGDNQQNTSSQQNKSTQSYNKNIQSNQSSSSYNTFFQQRTTQETTYNQNENPLQNNFQNQQYPNLISSQNQPPTDIIKSEKQPANIVRNLGTGFKNYLLKHKAVKNSIKNERQNFFHFSLWVKNTIQLHTKKGIFQALQSNEGDDVEIISFKQVLKEHYNLFFQYQANQYVDENNNLQDKESYKNEIQKFIQSIQNNNILIQDW